MLFLGLAIAADRTMYIADGTNIRAVDENDNIHTLIGHHGHNNHWQPIPCKSAIPANQVQKRSQVFNVNCLIGWGEPQLF